VVRLLAHDQLKSESYPSQIGNYNHFFSELALAIRYNAPNPVPPEDALQVMKILELALRSDLESRRIPCDY
jgi:scyllo-inositol 2-dehydrogenase (NADP+)